MEKNRTTPKAEPEGFTPAGYLSTLGDAAEESRTLLGAKSPTVRIPPNIRAQMKSLTTLQQWWARNRTALAALIEAGSTPPAAARAHRAGG